jgi:hypothetical protein
LASIEFHVKPLEKVGRRGGKLLEVLNGLAHLLLQRVPVEGH